jgi:(+)-trans-carveol dehydrogenase
MSLSTLVSRFALATRRRVRKARFFIAVDICQQVDTVSYSLATLEDLAETVNEVKARDRRIVASQVDVRDYDGLKGAVDKGVAGFGRLDFVGANAGIGSTVL